MEKTVSIIVPVYNAAAYLGRCMDSLLRQSHGQTEILLMDDGSTDGSAALCDSYAAKHDRVKTFHMPNAGVSAARNRGLEECTGEYLTFVDADDLLATDMLEHLVRILEQSGSDVAGCGYFTFHGEDREQGAERERGKKQEQEKSREQGRNRGQGKKRERKAAAAGMAGAGAAAPQTEILSGTAFIEKGILQSDTRCWSKLYRRESVAALRFDTAYTIGEDMLFLLELAGQGKKFCRSGYQGYGYYVNGKGAMLQGFRDSYMHQITCWQRALEIIGKESPGLTTRTETILLVSVMLTVGKLALLPRTERKEKKRFIRQCTGLVRQYARDKAVFRGLSRGYRMKVTVYRYAPDLYLSLYGMLCRLKGCA